MCWKFKDLKIMKHWLLLENRKQYESALKRIDALMDANPGPRTDAGKEMKLLLCLVEKYEDEHYSIDLPDPIEAIKIRMEDLGLEAKDLVAAIGDKGTVSKVLNKRIPLSLRMIRNLSEMLQLPADVLIQEGKLVAA
jgi:HTH-type transcriptional regulator / antitoxin HigA